MEALACSHCGRLGYRDNHTLPSGFIIPCFHAVNAAQHPVGAVIDGRRSPVQLSEPAHGVLASIYVYPGQSMDVFSPQHTHLTRWLLVIGVVKGLNTIDNRFSEEWYPLVSFVWTVFFFGLILFLET